MNYLNVKPQQTFDWDDINVGNNRLDHSQNFFSKRHNEHERLDEMEFLGDKMGSTDLNESAGKEKFFTNCNKENIGANFNSAVVDNEAYIKPSILLSPKIEKINSEDNTTSPVNTNIVVESNLKLATGNKENNKGNFTSPIDEKTADGANENNILSSKTKSGASPLVEVKKEPEDGEMRQVAPNLVCQWSTKKIVKNAKGAISKVMPPPPQAYLVKDIYQRNREEAERRRAEEERKMREFHSRPAPKFHVHHEQLQKRKPVHLVTVAVTPQVLKKSREGEEKRRKRLEEWKRKNQPQKFEPRSPTVLREKPFVPEKKPVVIEQCPFNLHTEKRLQERKRYDENTQKVLEQKQKQVEIEEEERKKIEKESIKKLRKAATFKARPNPFKN